MMLRRRRHGSVGMLLVSAAVAMLVPFEGHASHAQQDLYRNDFSAPVGAEWSKDTRFSGILGQFGRETVSLTLPQAPLGIPITLSFNLHTMGTWDGAGTFAGDIDAFQVTANGSLLLRSTFSTTSVNRQHYPDPYPGATTWPEKTGSMAGSPATKYLITRTFVATSLPLRIDFTSEQTQPIPDESWGLDNVALTFRPEATTLEASPAVVSAQSETAELSPFVPNLSAKLTKTDGGIPLGGQTVVFTASTTEICRATTDENGVASCSYISQDPLMAAANVAALVQAGRYTATFENGLGYEPSSDTAPLGQIDSTEFPG